MEIILAKNAGFCFGVKRAVERTYEVLKSTHKKVYSIGSLIHNEVVTEDLEKKGLIEVNIFDDINKLHDEVVIIRTHGVEKQIYEMLKKNNNAIIDLTCPYVKKIHKIVERYSDMGYQIIVLGDGNHPEVKGIVSYGKNIYVIADENEVINLPKDKESKVLVVFQTTTNANKAQKLVDILRDFYYNIEVINTICNTTVDRQEEVITLAKFLDIALIVGSGNSSNTVKLYDISKNYLKRTYIITNKSELKKIHIDKKDRVGVFAGASTPQYLIEEILANVRNEF